jgi:Na+-transporting methylmalonyl-CoA/oxaloacetate decarboxylase gamma subunit
MNPGPLTKVLLALVFLVLVVTLMARVFPERESLAQLPEIQIAQATERVAQANQRVARAIEMLAQATADSNLRIAQAIEASRKR